MINDQEAMMEIEIDIPSDWTVERVEEVYSRIAAAIQPPITEEEVIFKVRTILEEYGQVGTMDIEVEVEPVGGDGPPGTAPSSTDD